MGNLKSHPEGNVDSRQQQQHERRGEARVCNRQEKALTDGRTDGQACPLSPSRRRRRRRRRRNGIFESLNPFYGGNLVSSQAGRQAASRGRVGRSELTAADSRRQHRRRRRRKAVGRAVAAASGWFFLAGSVLFIPQRSRRSNPSPSVPPPLPPMAFLLAKQSILAASS